MPPEGITQSIEYGAKEHQAAATESPIADPACNPGRADNLYQKTMTIDRELDCRKLAEANVRLLGRLILRKDPQNNSEMTQKII